MREKRKTLSSKMQNLQFKKIAQKEKLKERGITLIALVVTIIIILILAGVTIAQITGENGLITRTRQAVDKYKEKEQEEQIQLGQLEQFVSDFSIIGGEENTAVNIESFTASGITDEAQGKGTITATAKVSGSVSKVEFKLSGTEKWETGTQGAEGTYTYTFEDLVLGTGYYVVLKVTDSEGGSKEATSGVVTLKYGTSATEEQVLTGATYLTADGTKHTGTMANNGSLDKTLDFGVSFDLDEGYYSGGHIATQTLAEKFGATISEDSKVLAGNKYIGGDGTTRTGSMNDNSGTTKSGSISISGTTGTIKIPENGYYTTGSSITVSDVTKTSGSILSWIEMDEKVCGSATKSENYYIDINNTSCKAMFFWYVQTSGGGPAGGASVKIPDGISSISLCGNSKEGQAYLLYGDNLYRYSN